ncbi:MAG: TetR family transcriptional regulator [Pseudomonadota bacterium]
MSDPDKKSSPRRRKGAPSAAVLDQDMIVRATLDLINEEGLDAFTLRALAKRLGVFPTAIYWHIPNRNEMLSRAVALALEDVVPARRNPDWREYLKAILTRTRKAIQKRPNIAPLVATQMVSNTHTSFKFVEEILLILDQANCAGANMVAAYNFVNSSIVGFTTQEFAPLPKDDPEAWQEQQKERLASIDKRRFPTLAANANYLVGRSFALRFESGEKRPLDDSFDLFVAAVIGGIEKLASQEPARLD